MQRTFIRRASVGAVVVVAVAAAAATSAFAASSNRHLGPRMGSMQGGFGPLHGGGRLGPRGGGLGLGGPGGPGFGGPRGGGVLGADVLTPAAAYLGVSLSTLESDLNGGKTLAQEATAKGKTASGLVDAIVAAEKTVLDGEVSAGWLTSAQETNVLADLKDAVTELVNNGPPVPPSGPRMGLLQTASTYLGISVSDLQTALKSGKTLADEVAAAGGGKTVDGLVQALIAPMKTQLDSRVSSGDITQAQETSILNHATTDLTNLVDGKHGDASVNGKVQHALRLALAHL